jgi:rhodanese-related sulfurtransferase
MIPTAVNIPLSELLGCMRTPPDEFRKLHGFAKPRQDQEIIFYCRSGKRAATAADGAKDNGFTKCVIID